MAFGKVSKKTEKETQHIIGKPGENRPVITVDYEKYAQFLKHPDLSEDQKREFIQTLWNIIVEFVSMGFGVHPLQQAQDACGQNSKNPGNPSFLGPNDVISRVVNLTRIFGHAVAPSTSAVEEGVRQ